MATPFNRSSLAMKDKYSNPWKTLSTRPVYQNRWISVREDQVIRPDGQPGIYGVIEFPNPSVAVLAVDADEHVYLVGQYRYTLNQYSWEIPEGACNTGEAPLVAAQRELREETGMAAEHWQYLGQSHLSNSVTNEVAAYFLATGLTHGEAEPEGTEQFEYRRVPFAEALRMVREGEITDSLSVIAILRYAADRR